jgi:hypothetical protein
VICRQQHTSNTRVVVCGVEMEACQRSTRAGRVTPGPMAAPDAPTGCMQPYSRALAAAAHNHLPVCCCQRPSGSGAAHSGPGHQQSQLRTVLAHFASWLSAGRG